MNIPVCFVTVVLILSANLFQLATSLTCLKDKSKECVIQKLVTNSPDKVFLPDLSTKTGLRIEQGNLTTFPEKLANQLGTVQKLELGQLGLKEIFVKPELLKLIVGRNKIELVEFKSKNVEYKLTVLDLSENCLKNLDGFEVLIELRTLHLEGNAIESIDLKTFSNMKHLKNLFIDRNHLTTVFASEIIELPALESFSLSGNKLSNLDVTNWHLESLTDLNISSNFLVHIDGLDVQLYSLKSISLENNWWHCLSLEAAVKYFNENHVILNGQDHTCGFKKIYQNICCDEMNDSNATMENESIQIMQLKSNQSILHMKVIKHLENIEKQQKKDLEAMVKRLEDLEKLASKFPQGMARDDRSKRDFVELKGKVQSLKQKLKAEVEELTKAQNRHNIIFLRLRQTVIDLNRSLDRETQKIAESEEQFKHLQTYVKSKLKKTL